MSLGRDLSVLVGFVAHDASEVDLRRAESRWTPLVGRLLDAHGAPGQDGAPARVSDLATVAERENLAQALILRLLTPRGALTALGHPEYGSRLHELVGESKSDALRNLCRVFVLEVVRQEPRVQDAARELSFDVGLERPDDFRFTLGVAPVAGGDPVTLGLEVAL